MNTRKRSRKFHLVWMICLLHQGNALTYPADSFLRKEDDGISSQRKVTDVSRIVLGDILDRLKRSETNIKPELNVDQMNSTKYSIHEEENGTLGDSTGNVSNPEPEPEPAEKAENSTATSKGFIQTTTAGLNPGGNETVSGSLTTTANSVMGSPSSTEMVQPNVRTDTGSKTTSGTLQPTSTQVPGEVRSTPKGTPETVTSGQVVTDLDSTIPVSEVTSAEAEILSTTAKHGMKPEPGVTTEPKSEATSPEPEGGKQEPGPEGTQPEVFSPTRKTFAEPVPIWYEAKQLWGLAWEFHIYFVGLAFAVLTVYSAVSIVRLWQKKQLLSRGFFISLNVALAAMGITRSLYFLVDGYNSHEVFSPDAVDYFMYTIGFPFLTSAFSVLFLALLQTTKVQLMSPRLQSKRVLMLVISSHIILSVTTDVVVGNFASAHAMMFACQLVSVMWGILLFAGYFYIFKTLYGAALRRQKDLLKLSLSKLRLPGINPIRKPPRLTLGLGVKVTLAAALAGLLYSALQIYAMIGVYGVFSTEIPKPWPWWAFKFCLRILEIVMCYLMSYVATQPFRYQKRPQRTFCDCFCWAPCHALCEGKDYETKEDSIYWNEIHGISVSYSQELGPNDTSAANASQYIGSPDEAVPLSSEDDITLQKTRSSTMDSDYGDIDLGSGPIVLNPHVLYHRNPELLSLKDDQRERRLDKTTAIKMPSDVDMEDGVNGEETEKSAVNKSDAQNRKATKSASFKSFLPRSPIKGSFHFLQSKAEQAGYSNLDEKSDPKKAPPVKRSVSEGGSSSVRTKSHQGSNYLSLSDLEVDSGVLDKTEVKGQEGVPRSPVIPEESGDGNP